MKKLLGLLVFTALLTMSCNDGKDTRTTCSTINLSSFSEEQQQAFQGIEIGTTFDYSQLDSIQKVAFNGAGLDSFACYTMQP